MKYRIKYTPNVTQRKIYYDDTSKIIMHSSGLSGGKTYNLCQKSIRLSFKNCNRDGAILAPSYAEFKKDILPTFEKIFEKNRIPRVYNPRKTRSGWYYNGVDKFFVFPWMKANRRVFVFSGENNIKGPNLSWLCVNEFSSIRKAILLQALGRVRIPSPNMQTILSGTLEDEYGYFDELLEILEKRNGFIWHKGHSSDNKYIDKDYVELLKSMYDSEMLKVYLSGEHIKIGSSYFYYAFSRHKNVSLDAKKVDGRQIFCGMDFNVGKMAAHFGHIFDKYYHVFDELYLRGDSNTGTMARAIKNLFPEEWNKIIITCDASGNNRKSATVERVISDVKILRSEGFKVRFKNVNPRLRKRQLLLNGKLDHGEILVNPKCKQMIKDLDKCKQEEDFTKDEGPDHEFSHMSDGLDYVIDYEFKLDTEKENYKITCL